ncbi:Omp85 domain-containing protein [Vibrio chagasii]|nr:Omp85 domain-containing protein [Vibrio chagasii]
MNKPKFILKACVASAVVFAPFSGYAFDLSSWTSKSTVVPFYFSTSSMGHTVGLGGFLQGATQEHDTLLGVGMYSNKGSYINYANYLNYMIGHNWLASADLYNGKYVDNDYYLGGQGEANSSGDSTFTTGRESKYTMSLKYVLPWGSGANEGSLAVIKPVRELKSVHNPLTSGVTSLELQPFYSSRTLEDSVSTPEATYGAKLTLDWDNRDDIRNTTTGSKTTLSYTYSPSHKDDTSWSKIELETGRYFDLGNLGDLFNKQVLAFSFYGADTPSWNNCNSTACNRPPEFERVRLGGLFKLRSESAGRYHGRTAVHYSAEYRVMPDWQPLGELPIIEDYYDVSWWQWVAFLDAGQVSDEFNIKSLHSNMSWSTGGAIRFQVEGVVVRTEMAWGSNESSFQVMINQPF